LTFPLGLRPLLRKAQQYSPRGRITNPQTRTLNQKSFIPFQPSRRSAAQTGAISGCFQTSAFDKRPAWSSRSPTIRASQDTVPIAGKRDSDVSTLSDFHDPEITAKSHTWRMGRGNFRRIQNSIPRPTKTARGTFHIYGTQHRRHWATEGPQPAGPPGNDFADFPPGIAAKQNLGAVTVAKRKRAVCGGRQPTKKLPLPAVISWDLFRPGTSGRLRGKPPLFNLGPALRIRFSLYRDSNNSHSSNLDAAPRIFRLVCADYNLIQNRSLSAGPPFPATLVPNRIAKQLSPRAWGNRLEKRKGQDGNPAPATAIKLTTPERVFKALLQQLGVSSLPFLVHTDENNRIFPTTSFDSSKKRIFPRPARRPGTIHENNLWCSNPKLPPGLP